MPPPVSGLHHCLFERFNDGLNDGLMSAGYHTFNVLNEPYFSSRPNPPLTPGPPIDYDFQFKPPKRCKRKALLVGVEFSDVPPTRSLAALIGPHKDIQDMRQFLIERRCYDPDDITVLVNDDDHLEEALQPTKSNIEKHCAELVAGACEGDRFFFHCCYLSVAGHTMQVPTDDEEEEDGKDEYILTSDNDKIKDNDLRKMMVDPLPAGTKFVAVFDACNSATLLDLEHYRCNRVFVPWVNKGFRRTQSLWNHVVRQYALASPLRSSTLDPEENNELPLAAINSSFSPYNTNSLNSVMRSPTTLPAQVVAEVFPIQLPSRRSASVAAGSASASDGSGRWYNSPESPVAYCDSPLSRYCTGHCRTNDLYHQQLESLPSDKADVICLSSAKDSQRSWQTPKGSLTQILLEFLNSEEAPADATTIGDVLTAVSHGLHTFYVGMHQDARQYKQNIRDINIRRNIRGRPPFKRRTVEMDNFQDPQISSHIPLDMNRLWEM